MGVGLELQSAGKRRGLLGRVFASAVDFTVMEQWVQSNLPPLLNMSVTPLRNAEGKLFGLEFVPHPAAEAVHIEATSGNRIALSAKTSTVGPHYHIFLCDLLHNMESELGLQWEASGRPGDSDPTGYFFTRNSDNVMPIMLSWLKQLANQILQLVDQVGVTGLHISMPSETQFEFDGLIATPLGPRDRRWVEMTANNAYTGTDIFPWCSLRSAAEGPLNAALVLMWNEVRWRRPLNDSETQTLRRVADLLKKAYDADSSLSYPWREWDEVLGYLDATDDGLRGAVRNGAAAEDPTKPLVGYRRAKVTRVIDDSWKVEMPGCFFEALTDEGVPLFDDGNGRQILISVVGLASQYRNNPDAFSLLRSLADEKLKKDPATQSREWHEHTGKFSRSMANYGPIDDVHTMSVMAVGPTSIAMLTINYPEHDLEWAIQTWKSVDFQPTE